MIGKYDSFRDSALHFLCLADWANESFGDVSDYGVYIWRISNQRDDVMLANGEFNGVIFDWITANPECEDSLEFRESLIGHFIVSENDQGQVTVRKFDSEVGMLDMFNKYQVHYDEWDSEDNSQDVDRITEENNYKFGDDRL